MTTEEILKLHTLSEIDNLKFRLHRTEDMLAGANGKVDRLAAEIKRLKTDIIKVIDDNDKTEYERLCIIVDDIIALKGGE